MLPVAQSLDARLNNIFRRREIGLARGQLDDVAAFRDQISDAVLDAMLAQEMNA